MAKLTRLLERRRVSRWWSLPSPTVVGESPGRPSRPRRRRERLARWALVGALVLPGVAAAQDHSRDHRPGTASASAPRGWRNPNLERTRRVVEEVIEKIHALHVDAASVSSDRCREEAIEAFREHALERHFSMLEGEARERFRRDLITVPSANLDACLAVIDSHLGPRSTDDTWAITDVLARGAIRATGDPFTQLIDQRTLSHLATMMMGERPRGYGIKLGEKDGFFVVEHVFRGYEAGEKGIQEGDTIVEIDGRPTVLSTRDEIQRRVNGDTRVVLRVYREGWTRGHDVELDAVEPREPNVLTELLPGAIGYLRIDTFLTQTAEDVESALKQLERQGARALILDVRDNPGGAIASCVGVANLFLGGGKVVCATAQRGPSLDGAAVGFASPQRLLTSGGETAAIDSRMPLVVLANGNTASASEMLAGALRDNGRARILGTRSYGKGVGQSPVFLSSANGERFVLMTTLRYQTPRGTSPQKVGLAPDVAVEAYRRSPAEQEEVVRLRGEQAFKSYVRLHEGPSAAELVALARDDEARTDRYPGFDAWARGLDTTLGPDALRRELRSELRSWASRKEGHAFRADLRDDAQLRRAHELVAAELAAPRRAPVAPPAPARKGRFY